MREQIWAPYRTALEQIVDAIAELPLEVQLEHNLGSPHSSTWQDFSSIFRQRHPMAFKALEQAYEERNRIANAARREKTKQEGIAKRKATLARKKATAAEMLL
jgi:hypothetical protein